MWLFEENFIVKIFTPNNSSWHFARLTELNEYFVWTILNSMFITNSFKQLLKTFSSYVWHVARTYKVVLYKVVESHHKHYSSVTISQFYQNGNTSYSLVNTLYISENKIWLPNANIFSFTQNCRKFRLRKKICINDCLTFTSFRKNPTWRKRSFTYFLWVN